MWMLPQAKHLRCHNKISWAKQSAHRHWQQHHGVITHFYSPKRLITLVLSSSPMLAQPPPKNSQVLTYYIVDIISKETSPLWSLPKKTTIHPSIHEKVSPRLIKTLASLIRSKLWRRRSAAAWQQVEGRTFKITRQNTWRFNINDLWFDNVCWNSEWNWMF